MGKSLSLSAGIAVGDVLVLNVEKYSVNGIGCVIANLWITGLNGISTYKINNGVTHSHITYSVLNLHFRKTA